MEPEDHIQISDTKKRPSSLISSLEHFAADEEQESRKLYNSLVLLSHMSDTIEPAGNWRERLTEIFETLQPALLPEMGYTLRLATTTSMGVNSRLK